MSTRWNANKWLDSLSYLETSKCIYKSETTHICYLSSMKHECARICARINVCVCMLSMDDDDRGLRKFIWTTKRLPFVELLVSTRNRTTVQHSTKNSHKFTFGYLYHMKNIFKWHCAICVVYIRWTNSDSNRKNSMEMSFVWKRWAKTNWKLNITW